MMIMKRKKKKKKTEEVTVKHYIVLALFPEEVNLEYET
jgi:hypothetical protein